jgi:hypothetical protein
LVAWSHSPSFDPKIRRKLLRFAGFAPRAVEALTIEIWHVHIFFRAPGAARAHFDKIMG